MGNVDQGRDEGGPTLFSLQQEVWSMKSDLRDHITRCDGRSRLSVWMMGIGFTILIVMVGSEGPVGRAIIAALSVLK